MTAKRLPTRKEVPTADTWDLTPMYLRKPDAEINWQTRDRST